MVSSSARLAAFEIAKAADQNSAQRPDDKTQTEGGEDREQTRHRIVAGKEFRRDVGRHIGIDGKVIPFQDIAGGGGEDRAPQTRRGLLYPVCPMHDG
jgi:hypothetical protein